MAVFYALPRGTRAALDALAAASGLVPYQQYLLTDESRVVVATSTSAYAELQPAMHVGPTAPSDTNLLWVDTS